MFFVSICKCQVFNLVFPIGFRSCWKCFKHGYYCPILSFIQSNFHRKARGCSGWFTPVILDNLLNSLLLNWFPWSCRIRFRNPKSRRYLLNNKSAAACTNLLKWSTQLKDIHTPFRLVQMQIINSYPLKRFVCNSALKGCCLLFIGFFIFYAFTFFSDVVSNVLLITWPIKTLSTNSNTLLGPRWPIFSWSSL